MSEARRIVVSLDIEVELTQWKIGVDIFDLALVCREVPDFIFQAFKFCVGNRLMIFREYAKFMVDRIAEVSKSYGATEIILIAHNGFKHDFLIVADNLRRAELLDYCKSTLPTMRFADSLFFFSEYKRFHPTYFEAEQPVTLDLKSLCHHFCNYEYKAHTAATDATALLKLMDANAGRVQFSFLDLILSNDYKNSIWNWDEAIASLNKITETERIRHRPEYGASYKQLESELIDLGIDSSSLHSLMDNGYDYFRLCSAAVGKKKVQLSEELSGFFNVKSQLKKLVDWCFNKVSVNTAEIPAEPALDNSIEKLENELSKQKIDPESIRRLFEGGYDIVKLSGIAKDKKKKELSEQLSPFIPVKAQLKRVVDWCFERIEANAEEAPKHE